MNEKVSEKKASATTRQEAEKPTIIIADPDNLHYRCRTCHGNWSPRWKPVSLSGPKDIDESRRVSRALRAAMKACWFNARKVVLRLPEYAQASYVEGWLVVGNGMMMEHGWVAKDGLVIDPTLPEKEIVYFPGLEFVGRDGIEAFLATKKGKKCKKSPFFSAFGWGGGDSPSYQQACQNALAYSAAFAQKANIDSKVYHPDKEHHDEQRQ